MSKMFKIDLQENFKTLNFKRFKKILLKNPLFVLIYERGEGIVSL